MSYTSLSICKAPARAMIRQRRARAAPRLTWIHGVIAFDMHLRDAPAPRRAMILCGGGARGAMEAGFYQAIIDLGISFDLVVGSSVGALNGACIAAGMPPRELADLWRRIRRSDVLAWNWPALWRGGGLMTLDPLRRLLRKTLPVFRFEDLKIPLVVVATDLLVGVPVYWHGKGDLLEPVIASMSLPGIFPPVVIAGRQLVDGAVANDVPFAPALERGVHEMLLILCTCCPAARHPLRSPLAILLRSFLISLETKYNGDLHHFRRQGVAILTVEPRLDRDVGLLDFRHADALIRAAYDQTLAAFAKPGIATPAAA